jgi:hypothetical protein
MTSTWRKHLIICLFLGAAGGSHLLLGSGVHRRERRRQLDYTGFPRAYLLDLHRGSRRPCRFKFNCGPVISQVRSVAHSLCLNDGFPDPARHGLRRLRKTVSSVAGRRLLKR